MTALISSATTLIDKNPEILLAFLSIFRNQLKTAPSDFCDDEVIGGKTLLVKTISPLIEDIMEEDDTINDELYFM